MKKLALLKMTALVGGILIISAPLMASRRRPAPKPANNGAVSSFFGRYVSVGDSITHGFQGGSVDETRQSDTYGARMARVMNTGYEQALLKYPGYLVNMEDVWKGNIRWYQWYCGLVGCRKTYGNQSRLNNFAITGEDAQTVLSTKGKSGFHKLVLGKNGQPQLTQALNRNPSFLTMWIGNNDALGAALHRDTGELTPINTFYNSYRTIASRIAAKQRSGIIKGVAVANTPDVTAIPYLVRRSDGSYKAFWDSHISGGGDILDANEINKMKAQVRNINNEIARQAAANGWALFDANAFFNDVKANGYYLKYSSGRNSSRRITADYLGGAFSLDGVHPSSTGHAIATNQFIQAINSTYGKNLSRISEYAAAGKDSLYTNPVDPRPTITGTWYGKAITFLLDLFV